MARKRKAWWQWFRGPRGHRGFPGPTGATGANDTEALLIRIRSLGLRVEELERKLGGSQK